MRWGIDMTLKKNVRSRHLYIVELENENWHTITRIKKEAEKVSEALLISNTICKILVVDVPKNT